MDNDKFIEAWDEIEDKCYKIAVDNGFWIGRRNKAECIALMHSELSEALEAIRKDDVKNLEEELADCIIRIMDFACGFNLNIPEAILKKIELNKTRPYKHGKKF